MARKKFEELDLCDPFLFAAALEDEVICRLILEMILGRPIAKIRVHAEHTILYSSDFRSVRLDIYASDEVQVEYDIEMQNEDEHNLPKRSRYYQGEMDITSLKPGEDFKSLRPCFIIFICTFDPFGKGLYRYTFENKCLETELSLGDEVQKIFLNTKGIHTEGVSEELIYLLKYIENSTDTCAAEAKNAAIQKIHSRIKEMKKNRNLGVRYMQMEELLKKREQEGERRFGELALKLFETGREKEIIAAASNPKLRQAVYREFGL